MTEQSQAASERSGLEIGRGRAGSDVGCARPHERGNGRDLARAKATIDMLDVLTTRTAGKMRTGESRLVEDLCLDRRTRLLEAVGSR